MGGTANCNLSPPKICAAAAVMFKICRKYFLGKVGDVKTVVNTN